MSRIYFFTLFVDYGTFYLSFSDSVLCNVIFFFSWYFTGICKLIIMAQKH